MMQENPNPPKKPPVIDPENLTPPKLDPTRFGDWEVKGRCIDF